MKIFLTGATGFAGAHTALALLAAGHELRLLVRDAERARRHFSAYGYPLPDLVVGDMRDRDTVRAAMHGCDAVLHAAAAVSLDSNRAQQTYDNNVRGVESVIGSACELGIANIVYVSSLSVLFQPGIARIDEATPLGNPRSAYARSKRDGDALVRALQEQGHPIRITYPAAIVGPDDPGLSEANFALVTFLTKMVPRTTTGIQFVDVRDLALAHRWLLEHPTAGAPTDERYILGGHYHSWSELHRTLQRLTGRRIRGPRIPGAALRAAGVLTDLARRAVPFHSAVSAEAMTIVTQWTVADSHRIRKRSGLRFRPGEATLADALRWLAEAGHLPQRYANGLLPIPTQETR